MISAFKHIRLSGFNLTPQNVNGATRLTLNNSGVAYFNELSTASGILNNKIDAFSGTFQSFVNNLDTQFATDAQLAAVSGALQTNINTVATNLAATGAANLARINSLSGTLTDNYYLKSNPSGFITSQNVVYTTGNQTISGSKTFAASRYVFSGADVIFTNNTGIVSGEWRFANRPTVNGTGVLLSGEAATPQNLASTGSTLQTNINAVATNLASTGLNLQSQINSLSGAFTGFTGALAATFTTDAELAAASGVLANFIASTGSNLQTQINSLSGYSNNTFATIANLATTGFTLNNRINSLSGTLTGNYATIANLATTGATLDSKINSLSGYSNSTFSTITNLASTGATLNTRINSLSGTLTSTYATIANLASTGSTLDSKINSLSGYSNSTFATITNLATTGSNLQSQINSLNTFTGNLSATFATDAELSAASGVLASSIASTGSTLLSSINSLSGYSNSTFATITNLASTGSTLNTKIDNLSGYSNSTFATISNLASTGSTLNSRINSLSGTLTGDYVRKATQQQFIVTLPTNIESTGINFPSVFASTPNSVQVTFEPSSDVTYMVAVKNRTVSGFTAEFSDVILEADNKLNVFASI